MPHTSIVYERDGILSQNPRWDPDTWKFKKDDLLKKSVKDFPLKELGEFVSFITYGQVGKRVLSKHGTVRYIQTKNLVPTGIDFAEKLAFVRPNSHNDPARSRVQIKDVLFGNAGVASIGRCVVVPELTNPINISQDIDILRMDGINPFYVCIYIKSKFGKREIQRLSKGVGAPKIFFDDVKVIRVPMIRDIVQKKIQERYLEMHSFHIKAVERKEMLMVERKIPLKGANEDRIYKENIAKAQELLQNLIKDLEQFLEGKKEAI